MKITMKMDNNENRECVMLISSIFLVIASFISFIVTGREKEEARKSGRKKRKES